MDYAPIDQFNSCVDRQTQVNGDLIQLNMEEAEKHFEWANYANYATLAAFFLPLLAFMSCLVDKLACERSYVRFVYKLNYKDFWQFYKLFN